MRVAHKTKLPLRHLITSIDGPTSSAPTGFHGSSVQSAVQVNEFAVQTREFRGVPGGEDLRGDTGVYLVNSSTDQQVSYQLVQAVKRGGSPSELQEIKWPPHPSARVHVDQKAGD
ncbi:hypothetical protein GWK47_006635 [Chionoecetes opilio]|uniref:Uncharacterized protein n=1 Tax=Chionoecetes opilio TaxID=41210 RepID=A0A8J5CU34_CHIOP|nr:hypothetical protein GWK47_006635 [Chionoecetes opilio]